jgi:formimidoylglutamate deiminase
MVSYFASHALLPDGWARDVRIDVEAGSFSKISLGDAKGATALAGPVLPGMANLHSHAFQRGMAGLTEMRGPADDDFWTWRELMYRFVERIDPPQAQAIATQLYIEMLSSGYTAVGEFHYVHHPGEMLEAHLAAARDAGIAITMLPSLYRWSGMASQPLKPRQKRFDTDVKAILDEVGRVKTSEDVKAGVAPHSLRAVDADALGELVRSTDGPVHIHAAEQTKEVEECLAARGKRPVEWLLSEMKVDRRWCMVHATHMTPEETKGLAASGAVAGLCPTTEGNLGDGIFPMVAYREAGGRWGIGGDSHVSRDPAEELRMVEYVQRLAYRKRNIVAGASPSVGTTLWLEAAAGGAQALGRAMGAIAPGKRADLVVLDGRHPDIEERGGDAIANAAVFSGSRGLVRDVIVAGRWAIRDRRHAHAEAAEEAYRGAVRKLLA